jgi:hypothetical protein
MCHYEDLSHRLALSGRVNHSETLHNIGPGCILAAGSSEHGAGWLPVQPCSLVIERASVAHGDGAGLRYTACVPQLLLRRGLARAAPLACGCRSFSCDHQRDPIGASDFDRFPSVGVVGNETTTGYRQQDFGRKSAQARFPTDLGAGKAGYCHRALRASSPLD